MSQQKNFSKVDNLIGSLSKEQEKPSHSFEIKETVEHEPSDEMKQFIKPAAETIKVPPDLQKTGIKVKTAAPKYAGANAVNLPLSDEMILKGLHAPITSSLRWLSEWAKHLLKKAHLTFKTIHGHVVRIMQK